MTQEQRKRAGEANKRYWSRNRERLAAKKNKHYHKNREKYLAIERERSYQKLYGISVSDYERMLASQGGKCAICGRDKSGKKAWRSFSIDHCHSTGRVRGLLCTPCNVHLGWFERFAAVAMKYLEDA